MSYSYLDTTANIFKASVFLFITTLSILYLFEPFGEIRHGNTLEGIMRITSYALLSAIIFYLLERNIKSKLLDLLPSKISIFSWYLLLIAAMALGVFIVKNAWSDFKYFSIAELGIVIYRVVVIAFFILLIVSVLFGYINKSADDEIVLKSIDANPEYLKLPSSSIFFLESDKNYTTVHYGYDGSLKAKLLRGSLSYFHTRLPSSFIRTHRSYIVNIKNIEAVSGNSQGLSLKMRHTAGEVKVSRKYIPTFETAWGKLST